MSQKDRTERLLNLLFALMASSRPVPKHVLRDAIEAYKDSPSEEAFERMFERDKEELRSMGVPILTVEGSDGVGGIEGYRVAASDYALPEVDYAWPTISARDLDPLTAGLEIEALLMCGRAGLDPRQVAEVLDLITLDRIDSFVTAKLSEKGLAMSPPAEPRTLCRRL